MRLLLVLASVAAMIGLAAPAQADPASKDTYFLAALNQAGITYHSPNEAIAAGKAVCQSMDDGMNSVDVVKKETDLNPGFTLDGAVKFAEIAASVYCPQNLGKASDKDAT